MFVVFLTYYDWGSLRLQIELNQTRPNYGIALKDQFILYQFATVFNRFNAILV